MRALTISAHGTLDQLELRTDLPVPEPGLGEVRVKVLAAALNHLDLFVVEGLPGITIKPPWILGADAAGIIDAVGPSDGTLEVAPGDYVTINPGVSDGTCEYCRSGDQPLCLKFGLLGEHRPGSMADYIVIPSRNVLRIPKTLSPEDAAASTLVVLTAWRMLVTRAKVRPGEQVLINGIGGGVALAALLIARSIGAHVWVTSSSDAKLDRARALGANETINYRTTDVAKEIRARTGKRGVDVVIDNVGAATWPASLGSLGKRGRLVTCGGTSGPIVETDVRRLFWNQWTIMGSTMGSDEEFRTIVGELSQGKFLVPVDSVHPLDHAKDAFVRLQSGEQFGKVVIRIADQPA